MDVSPDTYLLEARRRRMSRSASPGAVAEDADEAWVREMLAFDDEVGAEDRILVERVQQGGSSGLLDEGQLLPESERLVTHFQSLVVDALA